MRIAVAAFMLGIIASSALAQEQPTPHDQALANRLLAEINSGIACDTTAIQLRQMLAASQSEAKRLKDKYEPVEGPKDAP